MIESDNGVFTQLIRKFGAKGFQIKELWTIEDDILKTIRVVHGLIFIFKYLQHEELSGPKVADRRLDKINFAKQVISNACATQGNVIFY